MTYQEAIEEAKRVAKRDNHNISVYSYKKHWWSKRRYSWGWPGSYFLQCATYTIRLVITPSGAIAQ